MPASLGILRTRMRATRLVRAGMLWSLVAIPAMSQSVQPPAAVGPGGVHYVVRPITAGDRTNLDVAVTFQPDSAGPVSIGLPDDRTYGQLADIYKYVTVFEPFGRSSMREGDGPRQRVFERGADGLVHFRYVLSYDPKELANPAFAANIGPGHFHVAGAQWMPRIGNERSRRRQVIDLTDVPRGWAAYSSITSNAMHADTAASYRELATSMLGAVSQGFRRELVHGKPVSVYLQGKFTLPQDQMLGDAIRIVRLLRENFRDYKQPFFIVPILERNNVVAGTAVPNAFVAFLKPDVRRIDADVLLAHEMSHDWLPGRLRIEPDSTEARYMWLSEGFPDYIARKLLLDGGMITRPEFVDLVNDLIVRLNSHPDKTIAVDDLVKESAEGRFTQGLMKLSYYRGAILALNWDAQLRRVRGGTTLTTLLRAALAKAKSNRGVVSAEEFFTVASKYGIDAKGDYERVIARGEALSPRPDALGADYTLRDTTIDTIDFGFEEDRSFRTMRAVGVVKGGPAYRAGLREGMEIVTVRGPSRFANVFAWPPRPTTVIVRENGQERSLEFSAERKPATMKLFAPRATHRQLQQKPAASEQRFHANGQ